MIVPTSADNIVSSTSELKNINLVKRPQLSLSLMIPKANEAPAPLSTTTAAATVAAAGSS